MLNLDVNLQEQKEQVHLPTECGTVLLKQIQMLHHWNLQHPEEPEQARKNLDTLAFAIRTLLEIP